MTCFWTTLVSKHYFNIIFQIRQEALEVDSKLKDINQNFSKQNQRVSQIDLI
jgi:hypothetical protein